MTHSIDEQFFIDPGIPLPSRVPVEHEQTERTVEVQHRSDIATAALSTADFHRYIGRARRSGQLDPATEEMVRDVWVAAFKAGCRFSVERTAALSRPDVVEAIAVLAEVVRRPAG